MTIRDVEDAIDGAVWRVEHQRDLLAWHAMHMAAAFGAKKRDGEPLSMRDFLGRDPLPLIEPLPPTPEEETAEAARQEAQAAKLARAHMQLWEATIRRDHPELVVGDPPAEAPEEAPPSPA